MQACPRNLGIYSELRPRKARSKYGCLQCRRKRKRCNEQQPICSTCHKSRSICTWPGQRPQDDSTAITLLSTIGQPTDLHERAINSQLQSAQDETEVSELFNHFTLRTVPWMLFSNRHDWLIYEHVVPLARSSILVHHALLAVSGVHLRCSQPSKEPLALHYYDRALRGLNEGLSGGNGTLTSEYRTFLTTMILLCHCEFIDGNTHGGALQHVRACRAFVQPAVQDLNDPELQDLAVFLLESHGYFAVMGRLFGEGGEDVDGMANDFCTNTLPLIRHLPSFGSMFAYEPEAVVMMPTMMNLLCKLREPRTHGSNSSDWAHFVQLRQTMLLSGSGSVEDTFKNMPNRDEQENVVIRLKLTTVLILIQSLLDECTSKPLTVVKSTQSLIWTAEGLLHQLQVNDTSYGLLSSMLLLGSLVDDPPLQALLISKMEAFKSNMPLQQRSIDLLRWLWADTDSTLRGPQALKRTARVHGVSAYIC